MNATLTGAHDPSVIEDTALEAVALLQAQGVDAYFESFDGSIFITTPAARWHFGTVCEDWGADITSPDDRYEMGCCATGVLRDSTDGAALAAAIMGALAYGVGVEIWRSEATR